MLPLATAPQYDESVESQSEPEPEAEAEGSGHLNAHVQSEALNGRHLELVNKQSAALIVAD